MSESFLAEIRVVPYNFAPRGWAFCDGQLLPIAQNTALFSLLGTIYGGNGETNFALPNIKRRGVIGPRRGGGLSNYREGENLGAPDSTLTTGQAPQHSHTAKASPEAAEVQAPASNRALARSGPGFAYQNNTTGNLVAMAPETLSSVGGGEPHDNHSPLLTLNFIISLVGEYPTRA